VSPRDGVSAVRVQDLARHVDGVVGGEEDVRRRHIGRLAGRPSGTERPNEATDSSSKVTGMSGVHTGPGATALTRIPRSARRCDNDRVVATMAPLLAE
jgi:hypothetical protein